MTMTHDMSGQCCIHLLLYPATAEDTDKQYVCLELDITLPDGYPTTVPCISIRKPRGLGEDHLSELRRQLHALAERKRGDAMLYDIVELTKESLTESNLPHGICAVCQEHFTNQEEFNRTECYHYFHKQCFYRYIQHELDSMKQENDNFHHSNPVERKEKEVVCPVCRAIIKYDLETLSACRPTQNEDCKYHPDSDILQWQIQMKTLLAKQKAKGGVIDLDELKTKFLLPSN